MSRQYYENSCQNSYPGSTNYGYQNRERYNNSYGCNGRPRSAIIYGVNSKCRNNCCCEQCCQCCCPQPQPMPPQPEPPTRCCPNAIIYALYTIQQNLNNQVVVNISNSTVSGAIGTINYNTQMVQIGTTYVSICDIVSMSFNSLPDTTESFIYNCPTNPCRCNRGLESMLRNIIGTTFPATTNFTLGLTGNNSYVLTVNTVYGICNGILWAQAQSSGQVGQMYMAIPLCSVSTLNGTNVSNWNF